MVSLETGVTNASADEGVAVMRKPAAVLFVLSVAVLALALVPAAGLAAKGGGGAASKPGGGGGGGGKPSGGAGNLALAPMVTDSNGNGLPNWGDQVTFTVSTSVTENPQVSLKCSQNGVVVLNGSAGFGANDPWSWAQVFTLATSAWAGGAADCTATLYYYNGRSFSTLATIGFPVGA